MALPQTPEQAEEFGRKMIEPPKERQRNSYAVYGAGRVFRVHEIQSRHQRKCCQDVFRSGAFDDKGAEKMTHETETTIGTVAMGDSRKAMIEAAAQALADRNHSLHPEAFRGIAECALNSCNHESAKASLRHYLALRAITHSQPLPVQEAVAWQCLDKHGQWITMPGDWSPSENVKGYEYRALGLIHPAPSSAGVVGEWQPMETAPKDGTEILIFTVLRNIHLVAWDRDHWDDGEGRPYKDPATLWQPLPAAPQPKQEGE